MYVYNDDITILMIPMVATVGAVWRSVRQRGHGAIHSRVTFSYLQRNCIEYESEARRVAAGVVRI